VLKQSRTDLENRVKELTEELIALNAQLSERERLSAAALEMSRSVSESLDLDAVLDAFANNLVKAGQFRSLMISLVNEEARTLEVVRLVTLFAGRRGMHDEPKISQPDEQMSYDLDGENITCEVARTGRMEVVVGWDRRFDANIKNQGDQSVFEDKVSYFIPRCTHLRTTHHHWWKKPPPSVTCSLSWTGGLKTGSTWTSFAVRSRMPNWPGRADCRIVGVTDRYALQACDHWWRQLSLDRAVCRRPLS